jgi:hypothetical protein
MRLSPACSQRHDSSLKPEAHPTRYERRGRRSCEPYALSAVICWTALARFSTNAFSSSNSSAT